MGEVMAMQLKENGYLCAKYIPFGPIREVIPYLTRRAEENGAVLGKGKEMTGSGSIEDKAGVKLMIRERLGWKAWLGLRFTLSFIKILVINFLHINQPFASTFGDFLWCPL